MRKVKVSRKLADVLGFIKRNSSVEEALKAHKVHPNGWGTGITGILNDLDYEALDRH